MNRSTALEPARTRHPRATNGPGYPQLPIDNDRELPREEDDRARRPAARAARAGDEGDNHRVQGQAVPDAPEGPDRAEHDQDRGGQDHSHLQGAGHQSRQVGRQREFGFLFVAFFVVMVV